jgi:predicted acyl esterase
VPAPGRTTGTLEPFVAEAADGQAVVAWLRGQDWFTEALNWFRRHLAGRPDDEHGAAAGGESPVRLHVSEVGGPGEWRDFADWPPPGVREQAWGPHADGTLSPDPADSAPGHGACHAPGGRLSRRQPLARMMKISRNRPVRRWMVSEDRLVP